MCHLIRKEKVIRQPQIALSSFQVSAVCFSFNHISNQNYIFQVKTKGPVNVADYTLVANVKGSQIAATLTNQTGFILCSEKNSVNRHNTKNMFCLDCALIEVNIPVTISIILEKMFSKI